MLYALLRNVVIGYFVTEVMNNFSGDYDLEFFDEAEDYKHNEQKSWSSA